RPKHAGARCPWEQHLSQPVSPVEKPARPGARGPGGGRTSETTMQIPSPALSPSWAARAIALVLGFFRSDMEKSRPRASADMKPIDYEGEDGSLTEKQLRLMK